MSKELYIPIKTTPLCVYKLKDGFILSYIKIWAGGMERVSFYSFMLSSQSRFIRGSSVHKKRLIKRELGPVIKASNKKQLARSK